MGFEIEREQLTELFQQTSDGVMIIDRALRIVAMNPAAERLTGCPAATSVGARVCNEVAICQNAEGFELCETACPGVAAIERNVSHAVLDVNFPELAGHVAPATCVPIRAADGSPMAMILIRDISGRAELEEQVLSGERIDRPSGLYARTYFDDLYRREVKLAERQQRVLAAVVSTVTGDVLDGPDGDRVVRVVGEAVRASVRKVDIAGRYEHDTVAMILLDTDGTGAASLMTRLNAKIEALRGADGLRQPIKLVHGIGTVTEDGYAGFLKAARQRVKR